MNQDNNINEYVPSIWNPRCVKKDDLFSQTQNSVLSRCSLSLRRSNVLPKTNGLTKESLTNKENSPNNNCLQPLQVNTKNVTHTQAQSNKDSLRLSLTEHKSNPFSLRQSLGFSAIEDIQTNKEESSPFSIEDIELKDNVKVLQTKDIENKQESLIVVSSATEINNIECVSDTVIYDINKPILSISFGIDNCESVDVTSRNAAINRFLVTNEGLNTKVHCEVIENSQISTETEVDENMNETSPSPRKRSAVAVSLEIKKQKLTNADTTENSKVLILKTNAIEKISHVIVQPPNHKFVKRNLPRRFSSSKSVSYGDGAGLKQIPIDSFFRKTTHVRTGSDKNAEEMSRNSGVFDAVKCERNARSAKLFRSNETPKSAKLPSKRDTFSPRRLDVKLSNSESPSPRPRNDSTSSHSPRKNVESIHFSVPTRTKSVRSSLSPRNIPHHKIVAGTHFAVDAFSYGEIPNVKHYFLTHFHSDHYSGLKKSFNKVLFCSKITADLCISRLGVNPKCIHVISVDETLRIDGVEVTSVDANHCPGALMLIFTLPNGKTLLHTGDFRACPQMESYPIFWNRDIHTIYLDSTYCNPRYDFPTQDQSLEMALYILRQKKMVLEKSGKKFSSVLIVCGTYTIGKEKFFLGMSRRVGCSVWACPEKERVLQVVEGKTCTRDAPQACQLHVVPMRDLTHEKLRGYLDSLQGAFTEVVAFKPSGWENGKNSCVEKDGVAIHGIPYSEHSSFSELIRFVKFLKPKQVVPTVDISGGVKAVQKYFPCPLVYKDEIQSQSKVTDYFSIHSRQQVPAVT